MRAAVFVAAFTLLWSAGAAAQEWDEYTNTADGFRINFPGQPKVTAGTWTSQLNYVLDALDVMDRLGLATVVH